MGSLYVLMDGVTVPGFDRKVTLASAWIHKVLNKLQVRVLDCHKQRSVPHAIRCIHHLREVSRVLKVVKDLGEIQAHGVLLIQSSKMK